MNRDNAVNELMPFFKMSEEDVFNKFGSIAQHTITGTKEYKSLYISGVRKDRVLLVAHADTVWLDSPKISVGKSGNLLYSLYKVRKLDKDGDPITGGFGIGADDRAGCGIVWLLRNLGHSILITNGEEQGCLGSNKLMSDDAMAKEIQDHSFIVQFDRKGKDDIVFYDVGTKPFVKYCEESTKYRTRPGSYTDICVLCESICGVNISTGYNNEHSFSEVLNLRWWFDTFQMAERWLSHINIPKFER